MPGKSRHGKGKHLPRSKRKKSSRRLDLEEQRSLAKTAQRQPIDQDYKPAPRPSVSAPSASVSTPTAKSSAAWYPYIAAELQSIGILDGTVPGYHQGEGSTGTGMSPRVDSQGPDPARADGAQVRWSVHPCRLQPAHRQPSALRVPRASGHQREPAHSRIRDTARPSRSYRAAA